MTDSILGRWKSSNVVKYDIKKNTSVKMESYLDNNAHNRQMKVADLVDEAGWYSKNSDRDFFVADQDYVVTNGGSYGDVQI